MEKSGWPDGRRWRAFLKFMALFYVVFFPVYFGAGHMVASSGRAIDLFFDWERDIPLIPWMIWPYLSLFSLFLLPLFHMAPGQMATLSRQSTLSLVIAGASFMLLPAQLGFLPVPVAGVHASLFALIAMVDTPHNLAPSLHVTFGALILWGCAEPASPSLARLYRLWLLVMAASTVFVHQHHLLDVATGLGLAVIARRIFPITPIVRFVRVPV